MIRPIALALMLVIPLIAATTAKAHEDHCSAVVASVEDAGFQ